MVNSQEDFWILPSIQHFKDFFQEKLRDFYSALEVFAASSINTTILRPPSSNCCKYKWDDIANVDCRIIVVTGQDSGRKIFSLNLLHQMFHDLESLDAKSLCGGINPDHYLLDDGERAERKTIPSPIWITDLEEYQVVTIFGASHAPREQYLLSLESNADEGNFITVFPPIAVNTPNPPPPNEHP